MGVTCLRRGVHSCSCIRGKRVAGVARGGGRACGRVIGRRAGGQWGGTGVAGQLRGKARTGGTNEGRRCPGSHRETVVPGASRGHGGRQSGRGSRFGVEIWGSWPDGHLAVVSSQRASTWLVGSGRLLLVGRGGVYIQAPIAPSHFPSLATKEALAFSFRPASTSLCTVRPPLADEPWTLPSTPPGVPSAHARSCPSAFASPSSRHLPNLNHHSRRLPPLPHHHLPPPLLVSHNTFI